MGRAGWGIADYGYRKAVRSWRGHAPRSEGASLATPGNDPPRTEESSPRSSAAEFRTSRFLKGCEKTIVHIADRQIWIDQACAAKWLYVRNNPVRHRLVKHPKDLPFQGVMDNFD